MSSTEVTGYKILIYGKEEDRDVGRIIHLHGEDGVVGVCAFYVSRQVPVSYKRGSRFYLTFPAEDYPHVVDLLRNESPIYVSFNERTARGYLSTKEEETGEGDRF